LSGSSRVKSRNKRIGTKQKNKAQSASGAKRGSRAAAGGRPRPKMARISDEMKYLCSMLGDEVRTWPNVTSKSMFGMLGYYRSGAVFAALPVTRAIGSANGIIFKLKTMSEAQTDRASRDLRLGTGTNIKAQRWHSFEIHSEDDLRDALWWLGQAYENAK
jgi:hypothetical protein